MMLFVEPERLKVFLTPNVGVFQLVNQGKFSREMEVP